MVAWGFLIGAGLWLVNIVICLILRLDYDKASFSADLQVIEAAIAMVFLDVVMDSYRSILFLAVREVDLWSDAVTPSEFRLFLALI